MKAQVSLEYLLLMVVFLALISLSLIALNGIRETAEISKEVLVFQGDVERLDSAISDACSMGSGTVFTLYPEERVSMGYYDYFASFTALNRTIEREYACPVSGDESIEGKTRVENNNGEIVITAA